jgi:small subunit ribosomal protein S6
MLNNYETMYIIRPDITEDQVSQEVNKYQDFLKERNVESLTIRNHGKKRLAYNIGKHQDGIYVQMNYRVDGEVIAPLQRQMRISENVIRFLTLTVDEIPETPPELGSSQTTSTATVPTSEPESAPAASPPEESTEGAAEESTEETPEQEATTESE